MHAIVSTYRTLEAWGSLLVADMEERQEVLQPPGVTYLISFPWLEIGPRQSLLIILQSDWSVFIKYAFNQLKYAFVPRQPKRFLFVRVLYPVLAKRLTLALTSSPLAGQLLHTPMFASHVS
jgi:hypothetical protein